MKVPSQDEYRTALLLAIDNELEMLELDRSADVHVTAAQVAEIIPHVHPLAKTIGPVYSAGTVARFTETSRQNVSNRVRRGSLLGMRTASGTLAFPAFGFEGRVVAPWVPSVVRLFTSAGIDGWTTALWLQSRSPDLNDQTALEWLRGGGDLPSVIELAKHRVSVWTS